MGPFDVQRLFFLARPLDSGGRVSTRKGAAELVQLGECRIARSAERGEAELVREGVQVARRIRIVVGVDDGDGLATAVPLDSAKGDAGRIVA